MNDMNGEDKPLVWLEGEIKTPPFSAAARLEAETLLRSAKRDPAGNRLGIV